MNLKILILAICLPIAAHPSTKVFKVNVEGNLNIRNSKKLSEVIGKLTSSDFVILSKKSSCPEFQGHKMVFIQSEINETGCIAEKYLSKTLLSNFPPTFREKVTTIYSGYKVTLTKECIVGSNRHKIQAAIARKPTNNIEIFMGLKQGKSWKVSKLDRSASYSGGSVQDFLDEFVEIPDFENDYGIRCVVPNKDDEISKRINGDFVSFFAQFPTAGHMCFPASNIYNSWVCHSISPKSSKIRLSFVQLNAD